MIRLLVFICALPSIASAGPLVADSGDDVGSLAAFCKSLDTATTCAIADDDKIADLAKPAAPYLAARIFWAGDSITAPDNQCYVGLKTKQTWTVASLGSDCWSNGKYSRRLEVKELAVRPASSDLWLRYAIESSDPDVEGTVTEEFLVICGLAEGLPRCTAPIALGLASDGKPKWKVKATLSKAGALVLAVEKGKRAALPAETAALLGKTSLSFE
ncbi:MAG: hypothetical protein HOV81_06070 [Kofleriaceae bacterium]|nr:hypothetical protein [Kofleriaceae bacterium]